MNDLKKGNIQKVRTCFYNCETWRKNELSQETRLSLAATTNIIQELISNQEIVYIGESQSTGGRKSKKYVLNKDYYHTACVALKRSKNTYEMSAFITDLMGNEIESLVTETKKGSIEDLDRLIQKILEQDWNVSLIVFSIPGVCRQGYIDVCDYKALIGLNLQNYIYEKYKVESVIENDVNTACIGFSKHYPLVSNLAFLYQPEVEFTGCGMMIDKKLYNGFSHYAGELRFLPFLTSQAQQTMLNENPKELLRQQIVTLCAVMNPEVIGYCSDVFDDLYLSFEDYKIQKDHQPTLVEVKNFSEMIQKGLYLIAIKKLIEREGQRYE